MKKIRVRFAPSPTGYMHVGTLRTTLYNFLFAQQNQADYILRIEDTDRSRFVPGSLESLLQSMNWLGLNHTEGPFLEAKSGSIESANYPGVYEFGDFGPYIQSERLELYLRYAKELVEKGLAYYCFCEPERLGKLREEQIAGKIPPSYDRYCLRNVSEDQVNENLKKNCPFTIRLKVPKGEIIEFSDIVRGVVRINTDTIDDQILIKSDGFPTYHLASVVDDHLMKITHVIRAEEWIPSTPKHILLYRAFGWDIPEFAHLPLLLNPDKSKLSKRQGDVAVEDYIKKGYLKEALINFIALLGWNPGAGSTEEFFTLEELIEKFDLKKVHKAGAVFDLKKLDWINAHYIKKLSLDELYQQSLKFFAQKEFYLSTSDERKSESYLKKVLTIEQERLDKLSDVGEYNKFFFRDVDCPTELLRWKEMSDADLKVALEKGKTVFESISDQDWSKKVLEPALLAAAGDKRGELLWPIRAALTGEGKSPSPFDVAWVLGRAETIKRLEQAISKL
jgi:glutamyl-tRNA synthetase